MNDICQCGVNSSNLQSTEYFSFTCDPENLMIVNFEGYIYGFSLNNTITDVMDIYDQWAHAVSSVDVFGDILYTGQCEVSGSTSAPTTSSESLSLELIAGVILGSFLAIIFVLCCACMAYCWCRKRKSSQSSGHNVQNTVNSRERLGHNEQHTIDSSGRFGHNEQHTINVNLTLGGYEQQTVNPSQALGDYEQQTVNPSQALGHYEQYTIKEDSYNLSDGKSTSFPPTYTEATKMP